MVVDVSDDQRGGSIQIGFPQHETMHPCALSLAVANTPSSAPIDLGFGHQICSPSPPSPHPAPTALAQPAFVRWGAIKVALPPHGYLHSCALPSARAKTPSPPTHRLTAACSPNGLLQSSLTPLQRPRCTPRRLSNHVSAPWPSIVLNSAPHAVKYTHPKTGVKA